MGKQVADYSFFDRDYFEKGDMGGYAGYLSQEEVYQKFWMRYILRYGNVAPLRKHLDIGCGYGVLVNKMTKSGWVSHGIDVSEFAIKKGKEIYADIDINVASAGNLPFSKKEFGYVTCLDVIEHLPDKEFGEAFREIFRCLMEGGVAFIATPNVIDNCLVDIHSENYQERDESHINYKSSHELQHFLADAGFSQITVKGSSPYFPPIGVIFKSCV